MRRTACVFLMTVLLLNVGCSQNMSITTNTAISNGEDAVLKISDVETEEILFSTSMFSDYTEFGSLSSLVNAVSVVIRATVVSQDEAIVIGDYDEEDFDKYDEIARESGRVASDLLLSIRTPYTVKVESIYKIDSTMDDFSEGEDIQICTIGGNCRGYYLETEFPNLKEGEEYIFFLKRRNFAKNNEPKYTIYSPYQCSVLVDDLGTNKNTCADEIFADLSLAQLESNVNAILTSAKQEIVE